MSHLIKPFLHIRDLLSHRYDGVACLLIGAQTDGFYFATHKLTHNMVRLLACAVEFCRAMESATRGSHFFVCCSPGNRKIQAR